MTLPNYIIIGAMKCGTTTLAAQLGGQSGCFMTDPKEVQYFSDDPVYENGVEWYQQLFERAGAEDVKGEASTHYTKLPTYPHTVERMKALLPEVKLVYMIRNPMVRVVSHYIHAWSEGQISSKIDKALQSVPELVDYGLYAMQIAPFVEAYGKDAILLTSLEQLKADPQAELERIAAHIGLTGPVTWVSDKERDNVSSERIRRLPLFHGLLVDNPKVTAWRRKLVPQGVRTWVRNRRLMNERPELPQAAIPHLQARFEVDRNQLAQIFPDHPSLDLCYPFLKS